MGQTRDLAMLATGAALARRDVVQVGPREVHHHEHRAPTDESVKLLKEMEEQALAKIDETIRIEGNGFNGIIHLMRESYDDTLRARAIYELNGRKMTTDHSVSAWKYTNTHTLRETLMKELRDKMATEIATVVLLGAFEKSEEARKALFGTRLD